MHVCALAKALQERGLEVAVAASSDSDIHGFCRNHHLAFFNFDPTDYFSPLWALRLRRFVIKEKFDILHAHYSRDLWTIVPAMSFLRVAIVFIKHIGTGKSKKDLVHALLYRRVCHNIAISRVIAENLRQTHPISPDRISTIHHGVPLRQFDNHMDERESIRKRFGILRHELLIGNIGRLQVGKGHLEFIQMAFDIHNRFPNTKFMIVGEPTRGEEEKAEIIYRKIKSLGLEAFVILAGFRNDVPALLSAMDIFVFPSHAEAFGLVLIEAMAAGLAVVSTNCDGILDIVEHQKQGLLVPPKDAKALTTAVSMLIQQPQKRKTMAKAARKRVEKRFSQDRMIEKIIKIYYNCID